MPQTARKLPHAAYRHIHAAPCVPHLVLVRPADHSAAHAPREPNRFRARFWIAMLPGLALFWGGVAVALLT